jgi:hypothetical protein
VLRFSGIAFAAIVALTLVACGGGSGGPFYPPPTTAPTMGPTTGPTTAASSTVSFLVILPGATTTKVRRPNIVVPSNAASVGFTLTSVNGTASTSTATKETLSSSNSACQSSGSQLSCVFNLTAPAGSLIYTVSVYDASGNVIAEGNVAVTAQSGETVSAPLTLSGTAAKIALSVGNSEVGQAAKLPVTVQVEDAAGNTILGTYTSPITLVLTDASGATSLTTAGSDSPPADELLSSSDTATLNYSGAAMTSAATISASAPGIASSNVTAASFRPTTNYLAESGTVTLGYSTASSFGANTTPPSPTPAPQSTTYPVTIATGATFDNVANLIAVQGQPLPTDAGVVSLSQVASSYYSWGATSQGQALGYVGYADPNSSFSLFVYGTPGTLQQSCSQPYQVLQYTTPPASWNALAGTGACTTAYQDAYGDNDRIVLNADGSYTETGSFFSGYNLPPGNQSVTVSATGAVTYTLSSPFTGSGTMTIGVPSPAASTVPVTFAPLSGTTKTFYPAPAPSSAPNPWTTIGVSLPSPLQSDTFTSVGAIASLPSGCAVASGLVPASNPPLTEIDETRVIADPMEMLTPLYTRETLKHYFLNGVGEICDENQIVDYIYNGETFGTSDFFSYSQLVGGAIEWYLGQDTSYGVSVADTFTYITNTTLTATQLRVRNMAAVLPTATQAVSAAGEQIARWQLQHPMIRPQTAIPHFARH